MLILALPFTFFIWDDGSLGGVHAGNIFVLALVTGFVFVFLIIFQLIVVVLHFRNVKTNIPIKLVTVVLLFQFSHIFIDSFLVNGGQSPLEYSLIIFDMVTLGIVFIYALILFFSKQGRKS